MEINGGCSDSRLCRAVLRNGEAFRVYYWSAGDMKRGVKGTQMLGGLKEVLGIFPL